MRIYKKPLDLKARQQDDHYMSLVKAFSAQAVLIRSTNH